MTITWMFLGQALIAFAITFYRDYLKQQTEQISEDTWNACVNPGKQ